MQNPDQSWGESRSILGNPDSNPDVFQAHPSGSVRIRRDPEESVRILKNPSGSVGILTDPGKSRRISPYTRLLSSKTRHKKRISIVEKSDQSDNHVNVTRRAFRVVLQLDLEVRNLIPELQYESQS